MATAYEDDVAEWAKEQAFWLRSGQLSLADTLHLAEEIEGVGANFEFELGNRCSALLAHLARWQRQEGNRCELWRQLIDLQRKRIERMLNRTPSLRAAISDLELLQDVWLDALIKVVGENGCYDLPETSPWSLEQALDRDFFPDYLPS